MTTAPKAPPPLKAMTERVIRLSEARQKLFAELSIALQLTQGNITEAAAELDLTRDRANYLVRTLGLAEYAAGLRKKATGHSMGRPYKKREV